MERNAEHSRIARIVDTYSDTVMRIAYHKAGNMQDAEDITQEVFLSLFRRGLGHMDEEHLKAYIIRTAVNMCRKHHRKKSMLELVPLDEAQPEFTSEERAVMEAVGELPPRYREVLYLHYFEGYKVDEIARILKRPKGTVTSQLKRGREQLKELLEE